MNHTIDPANDDGAEDLVPVGAVVDGIARIADAQREYDDEAADEAAFLTVRKGKKLPPASPDAERALLGGIFIDHRELRAARDEGLLPENFALPALALVFGAMCTLDDAKKSFDLTSVVTYLEEHHQLDRAGGSAPIAALEAMLPSPSAVRQHAALIIRCAAQRRAIDFGTTVASAGFRGESIEKILGIVARETDRIRLPQRSPFAIEMARARDEVREVTRKTTWEESIFKSGSVLVESDMPPLPPLIQGLIPQDAVALLGGPPKHGKTWGADDIVFSVANNEKVFNEFRVQRPGMVCVVGLEDGERSMRKRWRALANGRDLDAKRATERMHYAARISIDLLRDEDLAVIVASARTCCPGASPVLLCIDPLSDAHSAKDESSNTDMKLVMRRARILRDLLNCAVLIIHHMTKNSQMRTAAKDDASVFDRFRGASSIRGAYDVGIAYDPKLKVRGNIKSAIDVEIRDGQEPGPFGLELHLEDDEHRHVNKAWWTFHRDRDEMLGIESKVVKPGEAQLVLTQLRIRFLDAEKAGAEPTPITAKEMAEVLGRGWNRNKTGLALKDLVGAERAHYLGPKGYTYRDRGGA